MGELRIAESEVREPPVERENVPLVDLLGRPAHHLEMKRLIVDGLHDRQLTRHGHQSEDARRADKEPRREPPPG